MPPSNFPTPNIYLYITKNEKVIHTCIRSMVSRPSSWKQKPPNFTIFLLILLCLTLTFVTHMITTYNLQRLDDETPIITSSTYTTPRWYDKLQNMIQSPSDKLKIALVNLDVDHDHDQFQVNGVADVTTINFKRVDGDKKWEDFFPEWVDEDEKWGRMKCPEMPLAELSYDQKVDVVVAGVPDGVRDVFRLQVNLVVANVLVNNGGEVFVVFIGKSGPMLEIFRCDDMIWEEADYYRIYKPDLNRLKHKLSMPVGSCMISSSSQQLSGN